MMFGANQKESLNRIEDSLARLSDQVAGLSGRVTQLEISIARLEGQWKIALWVVGIAIGSGAIAGWLKLMLQQAPGPAVTSDGPGLPIPADPTQRNEHAHTTPKP